MSTSHKTIVKNFLDEIQEGRRVNIWDFMTDDFEYSLETWIEKGFSIKNENGKVIVSEIWTEGPASGKLQTGDEIVSVQEAGHNYGTFEAIRFDPWGLNPSEPVHIRALRAGKLLEVEITPFIEKRGRQRYSKEMWKEEYESTKDHQPEVHYEVEYLIEEGDQVACILSCTGFNTKYQRPFAYSQALVFEFRGDKFARIFELHNTAAEIAQQGFRIIPPEEWPLRSWEEARDAAHA